MRTLAALLLLIISTLAFSQTPNIPSADAPPIRLATHRLPASYADLGPAPAALPAGRVLLFLNRSATQQVQLDTLIREQSDPASPSYHRYLTPAQFGEQFGPSNESLQAVTRWLTQSGFTVTRTLQSRLAIEFSATAPQLEAVFQTGIHAFAQPSNPAGVVYANTASPLVPAALAPLVKSISLSSFSPRPMNRALGSFLLHAPSEPRDALHATAHAASPLFNIPGLSPCAPTGVCYALVPGDYATIYDTKPLLAQGIDGAGVTIGIIGNSNIDLPTVQRFRTLFLPGYSSANLPHVILDGVDPGLDTAGTGEAYIDVETAAGVAPNATVNLYAGANSIYTNGVTLALARAVEDNAVSILSFSYGECEADLGIYNSQFRDFYEEAAAQGITVVVSSGDSGSAACDPPPGTSISGPYQAKFGLGVSGLASTPYNVAVGGTDFLYPTGVTTTQLNRYWNTASASSIDNNADWSSALSYIPEKPWNDSNPTLDQLNVQQFAGVGGGQSSCSFNDGASPAVCQAGYAKPAWQQGFGNDAVRDIPDVSFFAAIGSNYSFYAICSYFDGVAISDCATPNAGPNSTAAPIEVSGFGGTSVATPLFAGILALLSQKTQTPRLGLVTPTLYPLSKQFPAAFHDIATGTNSVACAAGSPNCGANGYLAGYAATAGFDLATGLGSLDANQFVSNWARVTPATQSTASTLSVTPTAAPHGAVLSFTVNVSGASSNPASGTVALLSGGSSTIQTTHECSAFPCTFSFNRLPGGSYPVSAHFLADGAYASSISNAVNVVITPEPSELLILNAFSNNQVYPPNGLNGQTSVQRGESVGFLVAPVPATTPAGTTFSSLISPPATGTISVTDNGVSLGSPVTLDTTGFFFYNSSSFAVGAHSLAVQYSGDASYLPSDTTHPLATPLNFTVVKATPTISISGLPGYGGTAAGYPLSLILYVSEAGSAIGHQVVGPTGVLTVTVNGMALPPVPVGVSAVTIPGNLIVLGNNAILVSYAGDANYNPASTQTSVTGILFQTYSDLGVIPTTTSVGLPVTFYLEVFRNYQQAYPEGIPANVSVTLLDGATPFATVPLAADASRISADAQFAYSGLSIGSHTITMQYAGDSGDLPSTGYASIVITPGVPSFTLSATPITFASNANSPSAISTLTITPIYGFTGSISLTCSASALPGGTCTTPSAAIVTGTAPVTVSASVAIHGVTAQRDSPKGPLPRALPAALCILFGLMLPSAGRRSPVARLLTLAATAVLLASLSACGAGGYTPVVSAGTYNVTIQASSGGVSKVILIPVTIQ